MKKLFISLLFLFPVITYPAAAASVQTTAKHPSYRIGFDYLEKPRNLTRAEKVTLEAFDTDLLLSGHLYLAKLFLPRDFHTLPGEIISEDEDIPADKKQYMFLPVIDQTTGNWKAYAFFTKQQPNTLYLDFLIVSPEHQRKGIGRQVIESLFKEIKPNEIKLGFTKDSFEFYKRLEFEHIPGTQTVFKANPYLQPSRLADIEDKQ